MTPETLVGIDCATDARNVGIALATWNENTIAILEANSLGSWDAITETVASWCAPGTLIALDAPPATHGLTLGLADERPHLP